MAQIIALNSIFERSPAKHKKFREVIVFVHHYGGNKHSFSRHIEWVNELGFDAVTFDLPQKNLSQLTRLPISKDWNVGLRHIWAEKIEEVLGSMPESKIMYSFSFPGVAVLSAIARRHAIDVKGWVAEGGPFKHLMVGIESLLKEENVETVLDERTDGRLIRVLNWSVKKIGFARKLLAETTGLAFGLIHYDRDVDQALKVLPTGFPILSLRGEKDALVQPYMIDDFFAAGAGHLNLQKALLPHAGHLQGFRTEGELYRQLVSAFLVDHSTRV